MEWSKNDEPVIPVKVDNAEKMFYFLTLERVNAMVKNPHWLMAMSAEHM